MLQELIVDFLQLLPELVLRREHLSLRECLSLAEYQLLTVYSSESH